MPENIIGLFGDYRGESAALGVAFFWASATVIFRRVGKDVPPLELNLLKGVIGIALLAVTLVLSGELLARVESAAFVLLILSGVVGIGIGDTAFFAALNRLGARRTLLLATTAPPMTAMIALLFLDETLAFSSWAGIAVTVAGVAWVVTEREVGASHGAARIRSGVAIGLLACLGQASGAVLSRAAMTGTSVSPLWSAVIRLGAGVAFLVVWLLARRPILETRILRPPGRLWLPLVFATFIGTYLALWLQQVALKHAGAGVAQTLIATSPLFVLPIAACMGARIGFRAVAGAVVALLGVALLFGLA